MQFWFNLLIKHQGARLYWGIFWAFFTAFSGVALLALSGWFITATALSGLALAAGIAFRFDMYMPGSGIRFFALSRTAGRYIERIYNHDTILRLISTYRLTLFKSLAALPLDELRKTSDSEWLGKLTADLDSLDSILIRYTIPPVATTLLVMVITLFLSFINIAFAFILGGFLLLCCILAIRLTIKGTAHLAESSASLLTELRADIIAHLQGAYVLQAHQLMGLHEAEMRQRMHAFHKIQRVLNTKLANIQMLLDMLLGIALIALVGLGLYSVEATLLSGPVLVMIVLLFVGASETIQSIPSQFNPWGKTRFSANRLSALMSPTQTRDTRTLTHIDTISIRIQNHPKLPISQQKAIELSLTQQQTLLILGRSGSGKSTLANLLVGTEPYSPSNTSIRVNNNIDLSCVLLADWHQHLAYLEQSNTMLSGTLAYNLAIGLPAVSQQEIWQVLEMVELKEWAAALPNGLDTWLGESGGTVSGGQARRICLCRLLLRHPQLVILDEPFNGIDSKMAERIWNNMTPWLESKKLLLLTHERPVFLEHNIDVSEYSFDSN